MPLGGALQMQFGQPSANGQAFSSCNVVSLDPVSIPSIGVVYLNSMFGCGSSTLDCDGGAPVSCDAIRTTGIGGLDTRGAVNFFGTALGDTAVELGGVGQVVEKRCASHPTS